MTKYMIRFSSLVFAFSVLICMASAPAFAQYHGAYSSASPSEDKKNQTEVEYPKVFSAHVSSVEQAKRLDELYDGLYASLWNYAISDFNHQELMYETLANERFQITRYAGEFSDKMESSMRSLNENHEKMRANIEDAHKEFQYIRERVREADKKVLDNLWAEKIASYEKFADDYFKMQYAFLKTYRHLVAFILKQGGGYYYNSDNNSLKFYKLGAYEYYGKAVDKLHNISFEQEKLLKSHVPVNMDPEVLK